MFDDSALEREIERRLGSSSSSAPPLPFTPQSPLLLVLSFAIRFANIELD